MILTIISTVLFFGFIILSVFKFGILTSYSAYSTQWNKSLPLKNLNLWSIVTIISAFLLTPSLIEVGNDNPFQFLGFFVPVYLIAVGLTPDWETNKKQGFWHTFFAILCAICGIVWLCLFKTCYIELTFIIIMIVCVGIYTKTLLHCIVFWLEMLMFLMVYGSMYL